MNTDIIDKIHQRVPLCFGVNPLPFDRLFKGTKGEAEFWKAAVIERREYKEALAALDTAVLLIEERDALIADLQESVKASGLLSMGVGAKREPSKDQQ